MSIKLVMPSNHLILCHPLLLPPSVFPSIRVTIIYDGDGAGIKAALRGIGLVLKEGLNVKVVLLPEGQDPDDFARRHTLEEVQDHIARNEQDFISFKTDLLLGEAGSDPLKRATLINDVADTISLIPDAVKRAVYVQACASKFEIDEQILTDRVSRSRTDMLLAEQKEKERARQREESRASVQQQEAGDVPPPSYEDYIPSDYDEPLPDVPDVPVAEGGVFINEPHLAPFFPQ